MKAINGVDNDAVLKRVGLNEQPEAKTRALVLIGVAAALCSTFTPIMTPPSVAASHPFSCPPQWLAMSLGTVLESPMPPPTPPSPGVLFPSPPPPPLAIQQIKLSQLFTSDGRSAASNSKALGGQLGTIEAVITEFVANRTSGNFSIAVGGPANATNTTRRALQTGTCVLGAALLVVLEFDPTADPGMLEALTASWPFLMSLIGSNLSPCGEAVFEYAQASPPPPPPPLYAQASPPSPPMYSPPPPPKPHCPIDFALLIDESGSMKKPKPDGSMEGPNGAKAFAKRLIREFQLGEDLARFAVVSFSGVATTRVSWSSDLAVIDTGIDAMSADGKTSISAGFGAVHQLFTNDARVGASKVVLLLSDGEQSPQFGTSQTAVDSANLVKNDGATVFAWGFAKVKGTTLSQIASDPSKAIFAQDVTELMSYINTLEAAVCDTTPRKPPTPPTLPPPAPDMSPPPPPSPKLPPPPPSPKLPPPPPPCLNEEMHFKCSARCHRKFGWACVNSNTKTKKQCNDDLLACKSMCIKCE